MSLRQVIRWLKANLRQLGCDLENLDIDEGLDTVICALRCEFPRACSLKDFYQGLFEPPKKGIPLQAGLNKQSGKQFLGNNIQSAEQFLMLAKMGLAVDKRKKK